MPLEFDKTMNSWPLMGQQPCMNREHVNFVKGHEPMDNLPWQSTAIMSAESEGRKMEVRVCKHCGCLYYQCWEVPDDQARRDGGVDEG